jgi:hypothetical protein
MSKLDRTAVAMVFVALVFLDLAAARFPPSTP